MDYYKNHNRIINILSKQVSHSVAEDIYQDALIRILEYGEKVDDNRIDGLIYVTCKNLLKNYYRANKQHENLDDYVEILQAEESDDIFDKIPLTGLQLEILNLLQKGYTQTEIQKMLKITKRNFENELKVIKIEVEGYFKYLP